MADVIWEIQAGVPFEKLLEVTLPSDRDYWFSHGDLEIRGQVREEKDRESELLLDMTPYIIWVFTATDVVLVVLQMTGAQTRELKQTGPFDIVMSTPGGSDEKAFPIAEGLVKRKGLATDGA